MRGFLYQEPLLKSLCHLHSGFETPSGCCRSNYVVLLSVWSSLYSQSLMLCTHKGQGMKSVRLKCLRFVQTIRRCLVPPCWELRQILAVQMSFFHLMSKTSCFLHWHSIFVWVIMNSLWSTSLLTALLHYLKDQVVFQFTWVSTVQLIWTLFLHYMENYSSLFYRIRRDTQLYSLFLQGLLPCRFTSFSFLSFDWVICDSHPAHPL